MECNVVKDLIPLYIDDCCSEESAKLVKEHMESCPSCNEIYESMSASSDVDTVVSAPKKLSRINDWKASVLQSVLLFISFAIITVGVALEAATSSDDLANSFWAFNLVIPATGFLLSLANWYFVRLYKNRKTFSNCSLFATIGITVCAYIWACFHYEYNLIDLFINLTELTFTDFIEALPLLTLFLSNGVFLTTVFCILSKVLSNMYAKMLGKE